jgi:hypothetical protein
MDQAKAAESRVPDAEGGVRKVERRAGGIGRTPATDRLLGCPEFRTAQEIDLNILKFQ